MPPDVADRIHAFAESRHVQSQTESALECWKEDRFSEYGDEIIRRVAEDQSGEAPEQTLSRVFAETIQENPDVHQTYMDDPDFREQLSEYVTSGIKTDIPTEPVEQNASEQPAQTYEQRLQADDSPEVIAELRAYVQYQQAYPQDIVFMQVENHYETYGVNAERVCRALGTKLLERRTPEGENVATFDSYSYQLVENKQKFISQVYTSKSPARGAEDLDEIALSYAEVKALAAGNPAIREKMDLDVQVSRLKLLKSNWQSERYRLEQRAGVELPGEIARLENRIRQTSADIQRYHENRPSNEGGFSIVLMDSAFEKRVDAGERLIKMLSLIQIGESMNAGSYCGFVLRMSKPDMLCPPRVEIQGEHSYYVDLGESPLGNIQRIENALDDLGQVQEKDQRSLETARSQLEDAKVELEKPWPQEQELREKSARLTELNLELDVGGSDASAAALAVDDEPEPARGNHHRAAER